MACTRFLPDRAAVLLPIAAALLTPASIASDCDRTSVGHVPISDLGPGLYLGQFQGGLYPGGANTPPPAHFNRGMQRAQQVVPRNAGGAPVPGGRIVMLSIGMSNTTQEFCGGQFPTCQPVSFIGQAAAHPGVNRDTLAIVDGAAGGQDISAWDTPTAQNYNRVRDQRLAPAGLTEAQVQVVWIKQANARPEVSLPSPLADAYAVEGGLGDIVRAARVRYPNLQMVFISSRIYAGYATTNLNPEPYAYETGFGVKWLIEAQINQAAGGGIDPESGDLSPPVAPWVGWGPYLWGDGLVPRADGLTWACADFSPSDGTHPATGARAKVGGMLLEFFLGSPLSPWFRLPCDPDFTCDGSADQDDVACLIDAVAGNPGCACQDPDFNRDGNVDQDDVAALINVVAGGGCP